MIYDQHWSTHSCTWYREWEYILLYKLCSWNLIWRPCSVGFVLDILLALWWTWCMKKVLSWDYESCHVAFYCFRLCTWRIPNYNVKKDQNTIWHYIGNTVADLGLHSLLMCTFSVDMVCILNLIQKVLIQYQMKN